MIEIMIARNHDDTIGEVQASEPLGCGVQLIRMGDMHKVTGDAQQIRIVCRNAVHQSIQIGAQMPVLSVTEPGLIAKPLLASQIAPAQVGK